MKNANKNFEGLNNAFVKVEEVLETVEKQQQNSFELFKKGMKDGFGENAEIFVSYLDKQNKAGTDFNTEVKSQVKGLSSNPMMDISKVLETVYEFNKRLYLNNLAFVNDSLQKIQAK